MLSFVRRSRAASEVSSDWHVVSLHCVQCAASVAVFDLVHAPVFLLVFICNLTQTQGAFEIMCLSVVLLNALLLVPGLLGLWRFNQLYLAIYALKLFGYSIFAAIAFSLSVKDDKISSAIVWLCVVPVFSFGVYVVFVACQFVRSVGHNYKHTGSRGSGTASQETKISDESLSLNNHNF